MYRYLIMGHPYVKKSNQKVVFTRGRIVKIDTPRYKEWHAEALDQLRTQSKPRDPIAYPVNLQCNFYTRTQGRVDLSALYEGIQDVLVEVGILSDDNYKVVASHDGSSVQCDPASPRMEITITPKEGV